MHAIGWRTISFVASIAVPLWRATRLVGRGPLRLARLVGLRSACEGVIPPTTQFDGPVHSLGRSNLTLGEYCRLGRGSVFESREDGCIELGSHVWLGTGCVIVSYSRVRVGDRTLIGEYVSIRDANHGTEAGELIQEQPHVTRPITIGEGVWIGRGAVILAGVHIGDGAVIGANAVVTRDVPAFAIAWGIPARVGRTRGSQETGDE